MIRKIHYPWQRRRAGGWLEGPRMCVCCPPLLEAEKDWGFWAKKDEEGRECCSWWELGEFTVPISIIYRPEWRRWISCGIQSVFHPRFKLRVRRGERTEDESLYSVCVDRRAIDEGQRRVFDLPPARNTRTGCAEASVQRSNHDMS